MWGTTAVGNRNMDLSNFVLWATNSMEDQLNDYERDGPTSSGESSTVDPQVTMLMPMQKMPITPNTQFSTPYPMFYPPPFGHPIQFPYSPYSTGHLPVPTSQQNEIQHITITDIKHGNSEDAEHGLYRNCLVCGDNNHKCGKHTAIQVCDACKHFFKRVAGSSSDKKATFQCSQRSGNCVISKKTGTRNSCEFCRFHACLKAGMNRQKVIELKAKPNKQKGSGNDN